MRSSQPSHRRFALSAAAVLALASSGGAFQPSAQSFGRRPSPSSSASSHASGAPRALRMSATSFQQARLAEQLRLSNLRSQSAVVSTDTSAPEEPPLSGGGDDTPDASDEARTILELETAGLGSDGMPFAPMMSYQKYLTMQEKRVRVTVRYSAEAGLRPFYLTVASRIKSTYPDVLLEKRILPKVGSDAGEEEAVFEVIVDGKTVIGKKKTKMLKVSSKTARASGGENGKDDDRKGEGSAAKSGDAPTPDIAGGRSVFVSLEKLEHELAKARKKRRPNTAYKSKEVASGGSGVAAKVDVEGSQPRVNNVQSTGMAEAVIRLERLKAMSTRSK
ncbi:hypothetical protein ACHAXT_000342 [Thalassiosira profunda]